MRDQNLNIVELAINKNIFKKEIICIAFLFQNQLKFYFLNNIYSFFLDLANYKNSQETQIIIYTRNLTFFFMYIFEYYPSLKKIFKISFFIEKHEVYFLNLKTNKLVYQFKCFDKLLMKNFQQSELQYYKIFDWNPYIPIHDISIFKNEVQTNFNIILNLLKFVKQEVSPFFAFYKSNVFSLSAVAVQIFFLHFNEFNIELQLTGHYDTVFRSAYYGPRCEVFNNVQNKNIFHFDFSNMYGQVMLEKFPFGKINKLSKDKLITLDWKNPCPGFYYIRIKVPKMNIPPLPLRLAVDRYIDKNLLKKGIFFPTGEFEGLYWYEEIILALKNKCSIQETSYAYVFERKEDFIFAAFAQYCINKRNESKLHKKFWKLILVSLYGRFGMSDQQTKTIILSSEEYAFQKTTFDIIHESWTSTHVILEIKIEKTKDSSTKKIKSNVIYAAVITAKARIKLYNALMAVTNNKGIVLYCDTDSIFAFYEKNVLGETHGEVFWNPQNKDSYIEKAVFASVRTYSLQTNNLDTTKIAGIPRNSISFENFYNAFYKNNPPLFQVNLSGFRTNSFYQWNHSIEISVNQYDKRKFISQLKTEAWDMGNLKNFEK